MYLFDKKDGIINVYELVGDSKKLKIYRHSELSKHKNVIYSVRKLITRSPMFTDIGNHVKSISNDIFEENVDKIKEIPLNTLKSTGRFTSSNGTESLLDNYYSGKYVSKPVIKIMRYFINITKDEEANNKIQRKEIQLPEYGKDYEAEVAFYLIITDGYKLIKKFSNEFFEHYIMDNIILITKPLYTLQLFEQSKFDELSNEDIDKLLDLFELNEKPIQTISLEYIENIVKYNLVQYNNELIDSHQKVLKRFRQK